MGRMKSSGFFSTLVFFFSPLISCVVFFSPFISCLRRPLPQALASELSPGLCLRLWPLAFGLDIGLWLRLMPLAFAFASGFGIWIKLWSLAQALVFGLGIGVWLRLLPLASALASGIGQAFGLCFGFWLMPCPLAQVYVLSFSCSFYLLQSPRLSRHFCCSRFVLSVLPVSYRVVHVLS